MPRTTSRIGAAGGLPGIATDAPVEPAWRPWLALLGIALDEAQDPAWATVASAPDAPEPGAPLLHRATLRLDARRAGDLVGRLADAAGIVAREALDPTSCIRAAIVRDDAALARQAEHAGVPVDVVAVLAQLAAVPALHAAARALGARVSPAWQRGYCPVCGAWPSLVETRGIARERRLRCGGCNADWPLPVLHCAFCDELDHRKLGSLIPEGEEQQRRIETCESCHGYLKAITTLGALSARQLAMQDLATVPLDLIAQDRGYARPERPAWPLAVQVVA
jgi:FdhE protein